MTRAENHLMLIDGARTSAEKSRQLTQASNEASAIEYEDAAMEHITALEFPDGSRLERYDASSWSVKNA